MTDPRYYTSVSDPEETSPITPEGVAQLRGGGRDRAEWSAPGDRGGDDAEDHSGDHLDDRSGRPPQRTDLPRARPEAVQGPSGHVDEHGDGGPGAGLGAGPDAAGRDRGYPSRFADSGYPSRSAEPRGTNGQNGYPLRSYGSPAGPPSAPGGIAAPGGSALPGSVGRPGGHAAGAPTDLSGLARSAGAGSAPPGPVGPASGATPASRPGEPPGGAMGAHGGYGSAGGSTTGYPSEATTAVPSPPAGGAPPLYGGSSYGGSSYGGGPYRDDQAAGYGSYGGAYGSTSTGYPQTGSRDFDTGGSTALSGYGTGQFVGGSTLGTSPTRGAGRTGRGAAAARPARRARLLVRHIDPWSTFKFSLVLSVALFFVWLVAIGVLYGVLDGVGVFDKINSLYDELGGSSGQRIVTPGLVLGIAALVGAVNIVLMTALATVGSFIYNICADLVGGIEVTLAERE